jgi:hypothetical protein
VRVWVHGVGLKDQHAHSVVMFGYCLDGGEGAHGRRWHVEATCGVRRKEFGCLWVSGRASRGNRECPGS